LCGADTWILGKVDQKYMERYVGNSKINLRLAGLKKCKIGNKTLLDVTVTYVTALLLHIVAIHI